jgi:ribose 5-phosphate isomerase B
MQVERVVLATDHAGFRLKETIKEYLTSKSIDIVDVGTFSEGAVDYPPIIRQGCAVVLEQGIPGIIFGGSGIGESIAANKVPGIRSARCCTPEDAKLARAHNDANVMSLGGRILEAQQAIEMVDIFLGTSFEGGRHERRVKDVENVE